MEILEKPINKGFADTRVVKYKKKKRDFCKNCL